MAEIGDEALREMARHRGLKLVKSQRRKPGGDFGRYALTDSEGAKLLGFGGDGLTATAAEIETYLRGAMHADWAGSTKGLKRSRTPKPRPEPKPKPVPKFRPAVANLLAKLPAARRAEAVTVLLERPHVRIERIVSRGQATPDDAPLVQDHDEWVILLQGEAGLTIATSDEIAIRPGDHVTIAAGQPHRVTRTSVDPPAIWLAVHLP